MTNRYKVPTLPAFICSVPDPDEKKKAEYYSRTVKRNFNKLTSDKPSPFRPFDSGIHG